MTDSLLSIGRVAEQLGVSTHLLRHWESEDVIKPQRTPSGARRYSTAQLDVLRIALKWQRTGMSLSTIAGVLSGPPARRADLVTMARHGLEARRRGLDESIRYLDHVLECGHSIVRECAECRDFAALPWE